MRIVFEDRDLQRLYRDAQFRHRSIGPDLTKQFRKKVGFLVAASDERDLYRYRALHFEKLAGARAGQHSIRLNDQWRLIVRLADDEQGRLVIIVEVVDYH